MNSKVKGYAAHSSEADLVPYSFERRELRADDVEIDILYCGICHTDIHHVRSDWGKEEYPMVPGHEIVGRVKQVGKDVTKFKVGQAVGVGCLVDSCQTCSSCTDHQEQYCDNLVTTYGGRDRFDGSITYGGYSERIVVSENFVLDIPENIDLAGSAPLLCAGITVYSPLRRWKIGEGKKVAIVGLGGLGHIAIKLAKAMGAEVTLFSRSKGKEEDAYRLGADNVIISTDDTQMQTVKSTFDLIIDTVPYNHDVNPYINTLAPDGALVLVGYFGPLEPAVQSGPLIARGKSLTGSLIGGLEETQEMLDFCGEHNVVADIEMIDIQDINDAFSRLLNADVKYRFVIDMATLNS
ncbi:NAD(P)-dependent alcohol dehydrogenase [Photobacterium ganghwense]|uniref:Hydroxyacid dehydrogenase n=1 Tax=Photobacterium ganghwense TaxID=320778 RepID=A0A0J1H8K9_9GAMM|nr:NAD(P)-dependent alcohol dehydrogenase [Photobacterium ganghwense]KLV08001.1 hydroxyacid dehydrogenase [Photobacterium ganghwense]PSU07109.1 NAD(P)-dependent alcohol dehydrogenase [Photobacterium ganghwense]QSV15860.1 NAD(P)-dependent alcohol dehydrogenase [Photobacterium ganghwense]